MDTAAAAELWAILMTLNMTPFPPFVFTDCLSILRTGEHGTRNATRSSRVLAGTWCKIAEVLDEGFARFFEERLVWMPAHQTVAMVGERRKSNGTKLTICDWWANRLVDALAKSAARRWQGTDHTYHTLAAAKELVTWRAAQLGLVTHAANNYPSEALSKNGNPFTRMLRDSSDRPKVLPSPACVPHPRPYAEAHRSLDCRNR